MRKKDMTVIHQHNSMSKFQSSIRKQLCLPCSLYLSVRTLPLELQPYYVPFSVFYNAFDCSVFISAPKVAGKDMLSCFSLAWESM